MYESLKSSLTTWNDTTSDRTKLQHFYIAIATTLLIIAGVIGLLNQSLGQQLLAVAIAAAGIFIVNAVAWALLQSFVLFCLRDTPVALDTSSQKATVAIRKPATRKK
ncbi:hypothetical protein HY312_03705 [Candidatus Saccharibacteria bacterium]|nr:hypothetical protein [Candidatus Saccharibacteria bacterium]